jgi:hypothetical protein
MINAWEKERGKVMSQKIDFAYSLDFEKLSAAAATHTWETPIVLLCRDKGFLTSRDESCFLTIASHIPSSPVSNTYFLTKKSEDVWKLTYIDERKKEHNIDLKSIELQGLQKILVDKEVPGKLSDKEKKEIEDIIKKYEFETNLAQLKQDNNRNWDINNGIKLSSLTAENYPEGIEKYVPYHHQSLAGIFTNAFSVTLQGASSAPGDYKPLVLQENYHPHVHIETEKSRVITNNDLLIVGIPNMPVFEWIPGHFELEFDSQTDPESGRTGQKYNRFDSTNSVLQELFAGNLSLQGYESREKIAEELRALKERALEDEKKNPAMLYLWYKKMTKTFLSGSLWERVSSANLLYINTLQKFMEEFNAFLMDPDMNMLEHFQKDTEFPEQFRAAMSLNKPIERKAIVLALFENEGFNKIVLAEYLTDFKTAADKLDALEEIFKRMTSNQESVSDVEKNHIKLLKNAYIEIVKLHAEEEEVKEKVIMREGLIDFDGNETGTQKTEERKIIEEIQEKKFKPENILKQSELKNSKNTYFSENIHIQKRSDYEESSQERYTLVRDHLSAQFVKINGHQLENENALNTYLKEHPMLEKYQLLHDQKYFYFFKNAINKIEDDFTILTDAASSNIEINEKKVYCVTHNSFWPIMVNKKLFFMPGEVQTVCEYLEKDSKNEERVELISIKSSNSIWRNLYNGESSVAGKTPEEREEILSALVENAKNEESPLSLYEYYKKQAAFLSDGTRANIIHAFSLDYSKIIQDFFFETRHFLIHHPELQKKLKIQKGLNYLLKLIN